MRWNATVLFGLPWALIGSIYFLPLVFSNSYVVILPAFWSVGIVPGLLVCFGAIVVVKGWTRGGVVLRAFRHGVPVQGEVAGVTVDKRSSSKGEHPWKLDYQFTVDGQQHKGSITTYEETVRYYPGRSIWVLYVPGHPKLNIPYPPIKMEMISTPAQ